MKPPITLPWIPWMTAASCSAQTLINWLHDYSNLSDKETARSTQTARQAPAGGASTIPAQSASAHVEVYYFAALGPQALCHSLSTFEGIWTQTGLRVQVIICRGSLAIPCPSQPGDPGPLVIRLMPGHPKTADNVRRPPLGHSFANHEGGSYSSVFLDSEEDQATANVTGVMVLAYAAAHEMGHLLLGTQSHTPRGLMKDAWDRSD